MSLREIIRFPFAVALFALAPVTVFAQTQADNGVYVADTFDDWQVQCRPVDGAADACRMVQAVMDENANQVSQVTVQALPAGQVAVAAVTFAAPLETFLPGGMTISVDDGPALQLPFEYCTPTGCFARVFINDDQLDSFIKGGKVAMSLVPLANRNTLVKVSASLKGFTAAFEQLEFQIASE
jgi:invasion protein IalB